MRLTAVHQWVEYKPGKIFSWFPEEVANARREAEKDLLKKQLSGVLKQKGNSFYWKMMEDLARHKSIKFAREGRDDETLRSPFFDNLKEIGEAYISTIAFIHYVFFIMSIFLKHLRLIPNILKRQSCKIFQSFKS